VIPILWKTDPDEAEYLAALDYLELLYEGQDAVQLVQRLHAANTIVKRADDILRAAGVSPLPENDRMVAACLRAAADGQLWAPLLLVRSGHDRVIIADGYHRCSAAYWLSEDGYVRCRLI
jgi:hypothetical protein